MKPSRFAGKKCLITGAASGIGRAVAVAAAKRGAEVHLTDINERGLAETVESIRATGGQVGSSKAFDVASFEQVRSFADELHGAVGSMDVVMNVAGIAVWGTIENLLHRDWTRTLDINLMGPIHVMECFLPPMIRAGRGGNLVNVSSAAGLFGLPWHAAYSASKFGLRGISEVLRFDLRRHRIVVTLVCPGAVHTGLVDTIQIAGIDMNRPEVRKLKALFVKHAVTPDRAADAILRGVEAGRFMVFTSPDIRVGYWFQRKLAWPYELVMRLLNRELHRATRALSTQRA